MIHQELLSFHQKMVDQRIWLAFKGAISQDLLVELGTVVKNTLGFDSNFKRVFAIFVEMTQNVLHYSAEKECLPATGEYVGVGVITVMETLENYIVALAIQSKIAMPRSSAPAANISIHSAVKN